MSAYGVAIIWIRKSCSIPGIQAIPGQCEYFIWITFAFQYYSIDVLILALQSLYISLRPQKFAEVDQYDKILRSKVWTTSCTLLNVTKTIADQFTSPQTAFYTLLLTIFVQPMLVFPVHTAWSGIGVSVDFTALQTCRAWLICDSTLVQQHSSQKYHRPITGVGYVPLLLYLVSATPWCCWADQIYYSV